MKPPLKLWKAFAASVAIHAAFILPFVVRMPEEPKKTHTLVVEFKGQITNRQVEEKKVAQEQPRPTPPVPPPPKKVETKPKPEKKKAALETPPPVTPPPQPQQTDRADQVKQTQQTVQPYTEDEKALLDAYYRALKKKLQNNLVYPNDAKEAGLWGTAVVKFAVMVNGDIRENTLTVMKSTGFTELDRDALNTVRASLPFTPPPKEIVLAVSVTFDLGN